jgi:2-iminobutanoate/2-iminopropanoate deaminase
MSMQIIETENVPAAIGPYSQAVVAGGIQYVSGQIPLDPKSGAIVEGDLSVQTRRVLDNLKAVVEAAGGDMGKVLKVTIFLTDMTQFAVVNEIYGQYFTAPHPARACVEVSALPKDVQIEMDAIVNLS